MCFVTVINKTRDSVIGNKIRVADTSFSRLFGLLGKRGLNAGEGLWIRPSSGVHTFAMMFPIDVIGLDKNLNVVKVWKKLRPYRITSVSLKVCSVIELPADQIEACQIRPGDCLEVIEARG